MPVLGIQITRMNGEKGDRKGTGQINISSNAEVSDVVKKDIFVGGEKKPTLNILFTFTVKYVDFAKIDIGGALLIAGEKKLLDSISKEWKKNKKLGFGIVETGQFQVKIGIFQKAA